MERKIYEYFPQTVLRYKVENYQNLNFELSKYIYQLYKEDKVGTQRSNRGGWHSRSFDLKEKGSIQNRFLLETSRYVFDTFKSFGWKLEPNRIMCTEMWAIINKKNDYNVVHTHPNAYLSAAYYVRASKNCGRFIVENPLSVSKHSYPEIEKLTELNRQVAELEIEEGDLLLFPAYLPHKVEENKSESDRVVVSFNINVNKFKL